VRRPVPLRFRVGEGPPVPGKNRRLPPIYVDEHVPPEVAESFREEGFRVVEIRLTRLAPSSMKNKTYSVFRNTVSTVKKSQARTP